MPAWLLNPFVLKLIAGGVLLLGLTGWWNWHNYKVRQEAIASFKVKLEECDKNTKIALSANKTLKESADKLVAKIEEQNKRILELRKMEAAAKKAKDDALAAAYAKERVLREEIARLTVIVNGPSAPTKEVACEEADRLLRGYAGSML